MKEIFIQFMGHTHQHTQQNNLVWTDGWEGYRGHFIRNEMV